MCARHILQSSSAITLAQVLHEVFCEFNPAYAVFVSGHYWEGQYQPAENREFSLGTTRFCPIIFAGNRHIKEIFLTTV